MVPDARQKFTGNAGAGQLEAIIGLGGMRVTVTFRAIRVYGLVHGATPLPGDPACRRRESVLDRVPNVLEGRAEQVLASHLLASLWVISWVGNDQQRPVTPATG
jgi:hypothetical protein